MASLILVCEGFRQGPDERVLQAIIGNCFGLPVLIEPAGGSSSVSQVHEWWAEKKSEDNIVFSVRDRDYRPRKTADDAWADSKCHRCFWRRHEVENYLVEPVVVCHLFQELRQTTRMKGLAKLPIQLSDVQELLSGFANMQLEHHVGRHLFEQLQQDKSHFGDGTDFRRPNLKATQSQIPRKNDWLHEIQREVSRVQKNCSGIVNHPAWTEKKLEDRFDQIRESFAQDNFLKTSRFLEEMDGKELLWAVWRYLHDCGATRLTLDELVGFLVDALQRVYEPNDVFSPDEFELLAQRMKNALKIDQ